MLDGIVELKEEGSLKDKANGEHLNILDGSLN